MADDDVKTASDATTDQSPEGAAGAAEDPQKVIDDLRRRQSGADKARDTALAERDALKRQLEALASGKTGSQSDDGTKTEAQIRAEVNKEFEQKLANERAADLAKVLDATFPVARAKFPSITDAAQLAELETVFGETKTPAPKPVGNNPQAKTGAKNLDDMSIAELKRELNSQLADILKGS